MTLRPHALELLLAASLAAAWPAVHAAEDGEARGPGLSYGGNTALHWQARLGTFGGPRLLMPEKEWGSRRALSLFGDYYIPRAFGLRATGGIVLSPTGSLSGTALWPTLSPAETIAAWSDEAAARERAAASGTAAPYLGVGYSGLAAQGSLGFFADVGLRGLKPRSSVQFGSEAETSLLQGSEAPLLRPWSEWRFAPVLQLGVSYAF